MANHNDGESRLRRYAQAFRREATPRPDLAGSLLAGARQGIRRPQGRLATVPSLAMAGGVLVAGLVIALALEAQGRGDLGTQALLTLYEQMAGEEDRQ